MLQYNIVMVLLRHSNIHRLTLHKKMVAFEIEIFGWELTKSQIYLIISLHGDEVFFFFAQVKGKFGANLCARFWSSSNTSNKNVGTMFIALYASSVQLAKF